MFAQPDVGDFADALDEIADVLRSASAAARRGDDVADIVARVRAEFAALGDAQP